MLKAHKVFEVRMLRHVKDGKLQKKGSAEIVTRHGSATLHGWEKGKKGEYCKRQRNRKGKEWEQK